MADRRDRDLLEVHDPGALRALAHPLRLRILEYLSLEGPATATQLGEALDESSGATSYHLRQLARYDLVEDAPDRGSGRERYWRRPARGLHFAATGSSEYVEASRGLRRQLLARHQQHLERFVAHEDELDTRWQDAAVFSDDLVHVTADELDEIGEAIRDLLARYRRDDPAQRPDGAREVFVTYYGLPLTAGMRPWRQP